MAVNYREFQKLNLPVIEQEILAKWSENQAFEKSVSLRNDAPSFVFYEGPPSANGMPGIHHVISRTLKDLVCRYKTMRGFQVNRKAGWDTHGLPIELGVEKELGITKEDIGKKISVEEYNRKCREAVMRYKDKWDDLTKKMGYWVDLNDPYITFDNNYIETLWYLLSKLYEKGLLYESVSIQPYSPAAGTGLSSHELNQPGTYKMVKDTSAVVMFKAVRDEKSEFMFNVLEINRAPEFWKEIYFLAWTTTPWTLPSNLGLTVGGEIRYLLVRTYNPYTFKPIYVIVARDLFSKYFETEKSSKDLSVGDAQRILAGSPHENPENVNDEQFLTDLPKELIAKGRMRDWQITFEFKGKDIEGCHYEQLLPFEANTVEKSGGDPFRVLVGDFVTTEDGTGIVHTAPAFGADDFKVGKKYGIGILTLVDRQGKFVEGVGEFSNRYVKNYKDEKDYVDVNVDICVKLKKENRAFKIEKYEHNYPHCWRTDKPVLYYPLDAWFIKTTALKDRLVGLNKTINWKPKSTGEGRFGNWLENMVDWNLSRSRFWGTPLPIWKSFVQYSFFERQYDDVGYSDEVFVGNKFQLQTTTSKNGVNVQGYKVDLKRLTEDFLFDNSIITQEVISHNSELKNGFESNKRSFEDSYGADDIIPTLSWDSYFDVFGIDLNLIRKICKERQISVKDIVDSQLNYKHIKDYCVEISNDYLDEIDLHKPYIDEICFVNKSGHIYGRIPDLIDVWFDSGAMPYAQWGLDHEKLKAGDEFPFKQPFNKNYPADFIAEGVDQTRGWFYTLHAIAGLLFDSVAYKTCVSNGLVLDKNGNKMSKRLGNVVDPFKTIEQYGADATRWYLITNASPWENMKFDLEGIREVQRKFFGTLYNTYQFFALYANVDGFSFKEAYIPLEQRPEIDRWILSSLNTLIKKVTEYMDDYEPTQAGRAIEEFMDEHLSNWYVRLCRRRFWKGEYEHDKVCAYQTLYECLETVLKLMAPISPFFSDALFRNLNAVTGRHKVESVHHADYPVSNAAAVDTELEERMRLAQDASSLVLSLRKKVNIKVRQPLQKVLVPVLDKHMKTQIELVEELIKSEVNVKEFEYLTEDTGFIKKKIKPNYTMLGKKLGGKMKAVAAALTAFTQEEISKLEKDGHISLNIENEPLILQANEVEITSEDIPGWMVANKDVLTVALDVTVTPELVSEGNARELVNRIQKIRKDSGFELTDRILVKVTEHQELNQSIAQFNNYICTEVLADKVELVPELPDGTEIEVNDIPLKVFVTKKA